MTCLIGISAKKQAGKTSLCEGLTRELNNFDVKFYSFADALKNYCTDVLGLRHEQVWGSENDKNTLTEYKWDNFPLWVRWNNSLSKIMTAPPSLIEGKTTFWPNDIVDENFFYAATIAGYAFDGFRNGFMTAREIMQVLGTDIMRNMFSYNIWVDALLRRISKENPAIAIIHDVRFPSEVRSIIGKNGYIIRLTRNVSCDNHLSETALDSYDWNQHNESFVLVPSLGIDETRNYVLNWLKPKLK